MGKHSNFIEKLKGYMMPFAMIIGFVFHQQVSELSFLIPYLIFVMLLGKNGQNDHHISV